MIKIAFSDRIARQKNSHEQEHQCHAEDANYDDQRIGRPLHRGEGDQDDGVERDRGQQYRATRDYLLAKMPEDAQLNDDNHHQVEESSERGDPVEVEKTVSKPAITTV